MTCPHSTSGCNYPEGDCLSICDMGQRCATVARLTTENAQLRAKLLHATQVAFDQVERTRRLEAILADLAAIEEARS